MSDTPSWKTSDTRQPPSEDLRPLRHLNQVDVARRWRMSIRTLERWRWLKRGPRYIKVGGRVLYRLSDVEAFEQDNERLTEVAADV
jgi:hypothetical protein